MVFKQSNEVKHKMAITTILSTEKTQIENRNKHLLLIMYLYVLKHFMWT